ncbi:MAG: hypothetical protein ACTSRU_02855 [Candidatus Hodarchaeales archaeon]
MFLDVTSEGNIYRLKLLRCGHEKFWYYFGILLGLIFGSIFIAIGVKLFPQNSNDATILGGIGIVAVLAVIILHFLRTRPVYFIDTASRQLIFNKNSFNVSDSAKILLFRSFRVTYKYTSSGSRTKVEKIVWQIFLRDYKQEQKIEIYKYRGSSRASNCPWIDKLAETIAELLGITLEDNTGVDPIVRIPGKTDTPLIDVLKEEYAGKGGITLEIPIELEKRLVVDKLDEPERSFEIYSVYNPVVALDYILLIISAILICFGILGNLWLIQQSLTMINGIQYNTILDSLFGMIITMGTMFLFLNIFTTLFGYWLFTKIAGMIIIIIDSQKVTVKHKGLLLSRIKGNIPLRSIERLPLVKTFNAFTIELMSDAGRVLVPGTYDEGEADLLRELIKHIFLQF